MRRYLRMCNDSIRANSEKQKENGGKKITYDKSH